MSTPRQDPLLQIYLHPQVCTLLQKIHFQSLHQNFCLTIFHLAGNTVKVCQSLGCHILALESDMEVLMEVLELLAKVATPKPNVEHVHSFDIDSHVKKRLRRLLDCE
jgi:hypothetical protein